MKATKRAVSVLLAMVVLMTFAAIPVANAAGTKDVDYTINSTYENVDWDSWGQYKGDFHCHTMASDGSNNYDEMIEEHYKQDFNILAITDHGTSCYSWTEPNTVPALALLGLFKAEEMGTTIRGLTQERFDEITTLGADNKIMIPVYNGNELNCTSFNNAHVNTWFTDYGNGIMGGTSDYETAISGVQNVGGICVINHPGEYTSAKEESDPELAYNEDYAYYTDKYTNLLLTYDGCLGIDINSKTDGRTHNDRKLWDILLMNCIPNGRSVYALATSDAHKLSVVGSGYTIHCLPELNSDAVRAGMENGEFFACSIYIKNPKELAEMGASIGEDLGASWMADTSVPAPRVTSIAVDEAEDTITIDAENAKLVRWIADGNTIATGDTIDLDDYSGYITNYVRAEVFGDGGILYTQAFVLEHDGTPGGESFEDFEDYGSLLVVLRGVLLKLADRVPGFDVFWMLLTGQPVQSK